MLKDISKAKPQPYSWSRVQLAWWTIIVLTCFITVLIKYHSAPELNQSTVILLGISAATIATARVIDVSEINDPQITNRSQDAKGTNFFLDILSDHNGVSIYRFQTVVFNFVFGVWFITTVLNNLVSANDVICAGYAGKELAACMARPQDYIMPVIGSNNLILLGLSSATYAALKTTENKVSTVKTDEEAVG